MEHSTPTVTPASGSTLTADDTLNDTAPNGSESTATLPEPEPVTEAISPTEPKLKFTASGGDLVEIGSMLYQEAEAMLRSGPKRRIKVRLGRRTIAEISLKSGAVGVLVAAMAAVAISRLTFELE